MNLATANLEPYPRTLDRAQFSVIFGRYQDFEKREMGEGRLRPHLGVTKSSHRSSRVAHRDILYTTT